MVSKLANNRHELDDKAVELGRQLLTQFQQGATAIKKKVDDAPALQDARSRLNDFTGTGMTEAQMAATGPDEWKQHVKSQDAFKIGNKVKDAGALVGMATLVFPPAALVAGALVAAGSAVIAHEKTKAEQEVAQEQGATLNTKGRFIRNAFKAFIGSNS